MPERAEIAQLKEALRCREAEVSAFQQISMAVASGGDLQEILQTIVGLTTQVMGCSKAAIFELDEENRLLKIRAWEGLGEIYVEASRAVDADSPRATAVLKGEPVAVSDLQADPELGGLRDLTEQEGFRAFLDVPLRSRDRVLGTLSAYFDDAHGFTPAEIEMFVSLADEAAVALETARLLQEQERRISELAILEEVGRAISGTLDLNELVERVHEHTSRLMDTTNFYIALYDPDLDEVSFALAFEGGERQNWKSRRGGKGLTEYVLNLGEPLLLRRNVAEHLKERGIDQIGIEASSWLGVPMKVGERVVGMIGIQSYEQPLAFDEHSERVLLAIARQAAVAIDNARFVSEMRHLNADLQRTLRTQEQLLQTIQELSTPVVPLLEGIILLPLVGHIDSGRTQHILDKLLTGVEGHRARIAIVDITGVPVVDTAVAQGLVQAAEAVRLLGAEPVLVGIMPEVAQTMVSLGVDLASLVTRADLQSGLEYAMKVRRQRREKALAAQGARA